MKKIKQLLLILTVLFGAADLFADSETMIDVDNLIKYNMKGNAGEISKKSSTLSGSEKQFLFDKNKKETTLPFVLNLFIGLGIGSYLQGDTVGGIIGTVGDLAGVGFIYYPIIAQYSYQAMITPMLIGLGVLLVDKIFQIIRPFSYADLYNAELNHMLFGGPKVTFLFTPFQRPGNAFFNEESAVAGMINYRF